MADTKISALTALDQSTADPAKTYVPLFHEDGSPLNRRMNFTNLRVGSFLHAGTSGSAARFSSAGNGVAVLTNDAGNDLSRVCFGGTTSSFPALKRSGAALHLRLADDSAFANLQLANLEAATMGNTSISVAWSGTGTATTPLLVNVTADPGPANAASKLLDLQVGGVSTVASLKRGTIHFPVAFNSPTALPCAGIGNYYGFLGLYGQTGAIGAYVSAAGINTVGSNSTYAINDTVVLNSDAADRLALRRSTNAQRFAVYRTFTASDNFERGVMSWYDSSTNDGVAGTVLRIGTEKGTVGGTARAVSIVTDGTEKINIPSSANNALTIVGGLFTMPSSLATVDTSVGTGGTATIGVRATGTIGFSPNTDARTTPDVAFTRTAAAVVKVTDGSTGFGALEAGRVSVTPAWSGTGTATTPLLVNVTADPGPANSASKLLDLQVGGSSRVSVSKDAYIQASTSSTNGVILAPGSLEILQGSFAPGVLIGVDFNNIHGSENATRGLAVLGATGYFGFTSGNASSSADVVVARDAADRLALRRAANAQRFSVYRTWSAADNFERGVMSWYDSSTNDGVAGTVLRIGTEKGTVGGTARAVSIITDGVERIGVASTGVSTFSADQVRVTTAKTPSSASDTGVTGSICWDSSFVYVCTATNTWKRAAIATW